MVNFLSLAAWRIQDTEAAAPSALTANQLLIDIKCQIKAPNPGSPDAFNICRLAQTIVSDLYHPRRS